MDTKSSYDKGFYLFDVQKEIERLGNQVGLMWPKEKRNLQGFGVRDGMSVLEFASGPGFFTENLATLVPNGSITCVEPNQAFTQHAREYLKGKVKSRLEIIETTGEEMALPENSFDFAIARIVFQFLKDPLEIAKKLLRVLKPGGRLVITDFDGELPAIVDPQFPEVVPILDKAGKLSAQKGTDLFIGRRLWKIMKHAGFTDMDLDSVMFHTGNQGARAAYPLFSPSRLEPLAKAGIISESEMQLVRTTFERYVNAPDSFYMRVLLMACGTKPGA